MTVPNHGSSKQGSAEPTCVDQLRLSHRRQMAFAGLGADLWGAVCLPIPGAASIVGTGDIFGDRLAEPIHILWHGARLSKRHCDAGFVEGIGLGICARGRRLSPGSE